MHYKWTKTTEAREYDIKRACKLRTCNELDSYTCIENRKLTEKTPKMNNTRWSLHTHWVFHILEIVLCAVSAHTFFASHCFDYYGIYGCNIFSLFSILICCWSAETSTKHNFIRMQYERINHISPPKLFVTVQCTYYSTISLGKWWQCGLDKRNITIPWHMLSKIVVNSYSASWK